MVVDSLNMFDQFWLVLTWCFQQVVLLQPPQEAAVHSCVAMIFAVCIDDAPCCCLLATCMHIAFHRLLYAMSGEVAACWHVSALCSKTSPFMLPAVH
jgi:hypothetical protein